MAILGSFCNAILDIQLKFFKAFSWNLLVKFKLLKRNSKLILVIEEKLNVSLKLFVCLCINKFSSEVISGECIKKVSTNRYMKIKILSPFYPELVVQRCSVKKVFLQISQNSQENACARVSFLIKFQA